MSIVNSEHYQHINLTQFIFRVTLCPVIFDNRLMVSLFQGCHKVGSPGSGLFLIPIHILATTLMVIFEGIVFLKLL